MIDFKSTFKMATNSLRINKMRSALTSLGIIIGVSAVIIMLGIGTGARKNVQANMESMGSNILTIRSSSAKSGGVQQGFGTRPSLTIKDAQEIMKTADNIDSVAVASNESKQLMYGNQNWASSVYGVSNSYLYIKNYEIESGRGFQQEDSRNYAKVAIIGHTVEEELFGDLDPIGRVMRVGNIPFKVIGTLKSKGSSGPMDQDDLDGFSLQRFDINLSRRKEGAVHRADSQRIFAQKSHFAVQMKNDGCFCLQVPHLFHIVFGDVLGAVKPARLVDFFSDDPAGNFGKTQKLYGLDFADPGDRAQLLHRQMRQIRKGVCVRIMQIQNALSQFHSGNALGAGP